MRYAIIHDADDKLPALLPDNYRVAKRFPGDMVVLAGEDVHDSTLDDFVLVLLARRFRALVIHHTTALALLSKEEQ